MSDDKEPDDGWSEWEKAIDSEEKPAKDEAAPEQKEEKTQQQLDKEQDVADQEAARNVVLKDIKETGAFFPGGGGGKFD